MSGIISVDFDGVIHSYVSGWKGMANIPDPPVNGSFDALFRLLDAGFEVAIFSSRSRSLRGRWAMKRWMRRAIADHWLKGGRLPSGIEAECWGDAAGVCRRFSWPWFKPAAILTIDDRAVTFNGDWSSPDYSPENISVFQPWNKRRSSNLGSNSVEKDAVTKCFLQKNINDCFPGPIKCPHQECEFYYPAIHVAKVQKEQRTEGKP
jgi:hypothetical protein